MLRRSSFLYILALSLVLVSCSGGDQTPGTGGQPGSTTSNNNASLNKEDYPVFPDADAGADPAVPPEQGGKGFKGEGWETNTSFDMIGDPRAVKGGTLQNYLPDFPGTLRIDGPENNSFFNYGVTNMVYEPLLSIDTNTLNYIPSLATHWQVSADKMTYRFRLNPECPVL